MLKHLLILIIITVSYTTIAIAQTDSTSNHQAPDSIATHKSAEGGASSLGDSSVKSKHQETDNEKHWPVKGATAKNTESTEPEHSPVKTISDERYNAYLKGDDFDNMSLAGELNHFPLPGKVLKYKKQLDLSPIQVGKLTKLANDLHRKKLEMGAFIIRNEKMLDNLFHSRQIDEGSIIFYTNRSGLYYGELKGAILMACYNTEKLLTDYQIKKLEALEKAN
jgi:hypothetical protein